MADYNPNRARGVQYALVEGRRTERMRTSAAVCLTILLLVGVTAAESSDEVQVRKGVEDNFNAIMHKDADTLSREYAGDYIRIGANGRMTDKAETIKLIMSQPTLETAPAFDHVISDIKIRMYGNVAVVTALSEITGKTRRHSERITQVWVKRDSVWQMTVQQRTSTMPIPDSEYH